MAKDVDWAKIKAKYVTGRMSYRELAKRHKLQSNAVARRGKAEGWPEARKAYRTEAAKRAIAGELDNEAERLQQVIRAADNIGGVLAEVSQRISNAIGNAPGDISPVSCREIRELSGAIKDMTSVLRNLHNLPTQAEKEAQRIAAERLELDRKKASMDENADKSITVEMEAAKEYAK